MTAATRTTTTRSEETDMTTAETSSKKGGDVTGRLLHKMLMPVVATAASALATYAAKKAPRVLEEKVVPKARGLVEGAGSSTRNLPEKAKSAASDAGDVAEKLTERARSVVGDAASTAGETVHGVVGSNGQRRSAISSRELAKRRDEREKGRAERRKQSR